MQVTLNGDACQIPDNLNLQELLRHLKLDEKRVAIERNHEIVKRERWPGVQVEAGDQLEIVHLVGGG